MRTVKLLWGTIVLLLVAVLILGRMAMFKQTGTRDVQPPVKEDKTVAIIGNYEIPASRLNQYLYQKYGAEVINQMLDRQAIKMEAEALKLSVTDEEIDRELKAMQQGYDSEDQFYKSMLEQIGMSREELRDDTYYKLLLERIATEGISVSDAEVNDYIKGHPDEFKDSVQLRIQQIITDTLEQADKTIELYRGGEDFDTLARERSLDTNTANDGGDLGWVEDKDPFIPAPIMKAAREMKVGDVSNPIPLDSGFAVIKLKDRKELSKGSPEQIKASVRKQLALQKAPPLKDVTKKLREKRKAVILDPQLKSGGTP